MRLTASLSGLVFSVWMVGAGAGAVEAQSPSQDPHPATMLILKDPTPRPPELDKMYAGSGAPAGDTAPVRQTAYFQQRQVLVTRASHQLSALAKTLDQAVGSQVNAAGRAQEVQVAGLIEQLAGNLHAAMAPAYAGKDAGRSGQGSVGIAAAPDASVPLTKATAELVSLARELEEDVDRTTPDTVPVGVLLKSSQVMTLAHAVKQRISGR